MKSVRRYVNSKKGINTILAALLMVVIVVVASVMVYAWSTGLLGSLMGGANSNAGKEALIQDGQNTAVFSSPTNVTLYIRNQGTAAASLVSYYVKDSASNTYQLTTWTGPSIAPNQVVPTAFTIGSSCGSCIYSGTGGGYTFQSGNQYTILVTTARNTQFSFTVVR